MTISECRKRRVCCNAEGSVDLVAGVTDQDDGDRRVIRSFFFEGVDGFVW